MNSYNLIRILAGFLGWGVIWLIFSFYTPLVMNSARAIEIIEETTHVTTSPLFYLSKPFIKGNYASQEGLDFISELVNRGYNTFITREPYNPRVVITSSNEPTGINVYWKVFDSGNKLVGISGGESMASVEYIVFDLENKEYLESFHSQELSVLLERALELKNSLE